jgi:hypothetical protein
MAIEQKELWSSISTSPAPRIEAIDTSVVKFADAAAGATYTLPVGHPVVYIETGWVQWDATVTTLIDGFVYPEPIVINAAGTTETLGVVMTSGQIHYDDIPVEADFYAPNAETFTQATLDGILKDNRSPNRKLRIDGLKEVR